MDDQEPTPLEDTTPVPPAQEAIFAALAGDENLDDDSWPTRPRRHGIAVRLPMALLVALVIAAGAFWAGAAVQKSDGTSTAAAASSGVGSAIRRALQSGGLSGAASAFAPAAEGTLTAVVGNTLYLTTSTGALVKVQISSSTTITRTTSAHTSGLKPGDTIVARGTAGSSGVVSATSITATAKGVTSTTGGFGGFGNFGGSSGSGTQGASNGSGTSRAAGTS